MRRRGDREINIFNIAFLDVITGALGAFVLLVILLSASLRKQADSDPSELQRLRAQVARLTQMNAQLAASNNQLAAQNAGLAAQSAEQQKTITRLDQRETMLAVTHWTCPDGHMRVYLYDTSHSSAQTSMPIFDPAKPEQNAFWTGSAHYALLSNTQPGPASALLNDIWVDKTANETPEFKLFYVLQPPYSQRGSCLVTTMAATSKNFRFAPPVELTSARPWALAARLQLKDGTVDVVPTGPDDLSADERTNISNWLARTAAERR